MRNGGAAWCRALGNTRRLLRVGALRYAAKSGLKAEVVSRAFEVP
jgi:hypothetical protein